MAEKEAWEGLRTENRELRAQLADCLQFLEKAVCGKDMVEQQCALVKELHKSLGLRD